DPFPGRFRALDRAPSNRPDARFGGRGRAGVRHGSAASANGGRSHRHRDDPCGRDPGHSGPGRSDGAREGGPAIVETLRAPKRTPSPRPSPRWETAEKVAALWYQAWGVEVRGWVTREPTMLKPTESVVLTDLDRQIFEAIVPPDHYLRRVKQAVDFDRFR